MAVQDHAELPDAARLHGMRVLLIDPSEKGAMPLYNCLVAEGLQAAGLHPIMLASRYFCAPGPAITWPIYRWLPANRWPPPPGTPKTPAWRQALTWLSSAATVVLSALILRPGIIHFQYPLHLRMDWVLIKLLSCFVPVVWTAHDIVTHDPGKNAIARARRIYSAAQLVLVHSVPAAAQLKSLSGTRSLVVNHPVRKLDSIPDRATARQRFHLHPARRTAAAIGFIRAYKGYRLIADVWELLGDKAPDLLILGQLVDQSEAGSIERLRAHPRVSLCLDYASNEDVVAAMVAADVILLPHERGSDSGSLHLARAVGTPVISSDMAQLASVVIRTGAGRVLPRDPAVWAQALLDDLPPPPPPPPPPVAAGRDHLEAYRWALRRSRKVKALSR